MTTSRDPVLARAFGRVLKASRTAAGLSQEHLADVADCQRNYVSTLELGNNQPTLGLFVALANGLKIQPEEFMLRVRAEAASLARLGE